MNKVYAGLPKPGHPFYDSVGRDGAAQVRSPFFARYLGLENVQIPSAGTEDIGGVAVPRPVAVLTDLLERIPNAPGGLVSVGPGEEPWVGCARLLLQRLEQRRILTVLPADQHLNPDLLIAHGETGCVLHDRSLLPRERSTVAADPVLSAKMRDGRALTVAEYQRIFGAIEDKEDRNFVPHCREGVVEYVPEVCAAFARQRDELLRQMANGADLPTPWLLPDFKTGLSCLSAPDRRGLRGNALREILLASQQGLLLEGCERRHFKLALVGGTAHEYSVAELVRFLVDLDYSVVLCLAATGGLGIASRRATAFELVERYGTKVFATYDWPLAEFLGPAPADWAGLASAVRRLDDEFHEAWMADYVERIGRGISSQQVPVIVSAADITRVRSTGGGAP